MPNNMMSLSNDHCNIKIANGNTKVMLACFLITLIIVGATSQLGHETALARVAATLKINDNQVR